MNRPTVSHVGCLGLLLLGGLTACVTEDPVNLGIDYALPDHVDSAAATVAASSGLAVIDSNPNQLLHLFSDSVQPNRQGLAVGPSGNTVQPVVIDVQPTMPSSSEQWKVLVQPDGQIWFQQPGTGLCLTASLSMEPCASAPSSTLAWRAVPLLYSDLARLRSEGTGQCLALSSDASTIVLGPCDGASVWRLELISAAGSSVPGLGYGSAQYSAGGGLSTLGAASMRPCTDATLFNPSFDTLSWLQLSNAGDTDLTLDRVDNLSSIVSLGTLPAHSATVLQLPGGSTVRLSANNRCLAFVDTAVVLRVSNEGSLLTQGGALHSCSELSTLRSTLDLRPAQLRLINESTTTLTLDWIDYTAGDKTASYGTVASGDSTTVYTFQTNAWMLAAPDGTCQGIMILNQDPQP